MTDGEFQSSFFELQHDDDIAIVTLKREQLTDDENLEQLDQELSLVQGQDEGRKIVCDLSSVKYMSSSAIGKLITLHRKAIRTNGRVAICGLQDTVHDSLAASHLLGYFNVQPDIATAVAALKS